MTQKEAIKQALKKLGGRAPLQEIYPLVLPLIDFKEGSNIQATLRTTMKRSPKLFRHSPNKPDGWWELISYQEEIAVRDKEIAELKAEVERLKKVPTEDAFVKRFVEATIAQFKHKRNQADSIRQIMDKLGRSDAEATLDAWIEGKEKKTTPLAGNFILTNETNIGTNYGPNIENNGGKIVCEDEMKIKAIP